MARLPLVLIPAFLVPLFFMLHLTALFQSRPRRAAGSRTVQPARESPPPARESRTAS